MMASWRCTHISWRVSAQASGRSTTCEVSPTLVPAAEARLEAVKTQRCWVADVIKTISLLNQLESADVTQGDPEAYGPSEQTFKDRTFIGHGGAGDVDELATAEEEVAEAEETRARL